MIVWPAYTSRYYPPSEHEPRFDEISPVKIFWGVDYEHATHFFLNIGQLYGTMRQVW